MAFQNLLFKKKLFTQIIDYQGRYIHILYWGCLHGRIFMKINTIFNTHAILAALFPVY